jgi:hypothetical protein
LELQAVREEEREEGREEGQNSVLELLDAEIARLVRQKLQTQTVQS